MPSIKPYNRTNAVEYAHKWAFKRNPKYYDFEPLTGDCTNFASQCLYAGGATMNYTPVFGWYYINPYKRTPSWTGVQYLYNFLTTNKKQGPFGRLVEAKDIMIGDLIQLSFSQNAFVHTLIVVQTGNPPRIDNILIAAHTNDSDNRPLTSYPYEKLRFIHIEGIREM